MSLPTPASALLYVERTLWAAKAQLICAPPRLYYNVKEYLLIDEVSRRHLELIASSDGEKKGSLLSILDATFTPVGARTLSTWIVYPLLDLVAITSLATTPSKRRSRADLGGPLTQALVSSWRPGADGGPVGSNAGDTARLPAKLGQALDAVADSMKQHLAGFKSTAIQELAESILTRSPSWLG